MFYYFFRIYAILTLSLLSQGGQTEVWKFGMMGDTHDAPPKTPGQAGVAVDYIRLVNAEFIRHGVDFVVQCGDLADAEGGQDVDGFKVRFEAAEDLRKAGIPFYAVRGNHDQSPLRLRQMEEFFMPGAKGTHRPSGFVRRGVDYGFVHKNVSLFFLDIDNSLHPDRLVRWSEWVKDCRGVDERPPHCVVFSHRNLHVPFSFRECQFGQLNGDAPDEQNLFYKFLSDAGVGLFCSAHIHVHLRGKAMSPDGRYALDCLVCAPCGEKITPFEVPYKPGNNVDKVMGKCFGYYIVTVTADSLRLDFYAMPGSGNQPAPDKADFKLIDSWQLPVKKVHDHK